ncbi:hypothetical protein [Agrobacterium pusense]|uniref:hypothetical protein n=1 Tax=Agrobacterium pusense TaxID=648995 RepID=UPI002FDDB40B
MAELENETLELIGALNQSGFEWLSAEILVGLRLGKTNLASEEHLRRIREKVSSGDDEQDYFEYEDEHDDILYGEEQVQAAIEMVKSRLTMASRMLLQCEENLKSIRAHDAISKPESTQIRFGLFEDARPISGASIASMIEVVSEIDVALDDWRGSSRPVMK